MNMKPIQFPIYRAANGKAGHYQSFRQITADQVSAKPGRGTKIGVQLPPIDACLTDRLFGTNFIQLQKIPSVLDRQCGINCFNEVFMEDDVVFQNKTNFKI